MNGNVQAKKLAQELASGIVILLKACKKKWKYEELSEVEKSGLVPATLYFLVDGSKIIGSIHFRYQLNDYLEKYGGHIGYGVRPSERRKGYGKIMLGMLLDIIRRQAYKKILVTCDDTNIASIKTIESNGGKLENVIEEDGKMKRRYWIVLA